MNNKQKFMILGALDAVLAILGLIIAIKSKSFIGVLLPIGSMMLLGLSKITVFEKLFSGAIIFINVVTMVIYLVRIYFFE